MIPIFDLGNTQTLAAGNRYTYTVTAQDQLDYDGFLLTVTDTIILGNGDNVVDYTTTGATQVVTTAIGEKVYFDVASGGTGSGTLGEYYQAKTVQVDLELDNVDFDTDTTNWTALGISTGDQAPIVPAVSELVELNGSVTKIVGTTDTVILFTYTN